MRHILAAFNRDLPMVQSDRFGLLLKVTKILEQIESDGKLDAAIEQLLTFIGVDHLLPDNYGKFQPLVLEGMSYWLSRIPRARLSEKITDQILLPNDVSKGQRICVLINDMPTLQKLGQVICRSPGLHPEFKLALVELEDNIQSTSYDLLLPFLEEEFKSLSPEYDFKLEKSILAEGSVCAIVEGKVRSRGEAGYYRIIVKIVKPSVRQNLRAELDLFDELAGFLDRNRTKWELGEFQFSNTFDQVRWLLEKEINLTVEQANLTFAHNYYQNTTKLRLPHLFPCSTPNMTVMSRVKGNKITDVAGLNRSQKRLLISSLTNHCILRPIQDIGEASIFHGDPHAGNIAYLFLDKKPELIFYDWGMMGRLSRLERFSLVLMAFGILAQSSRAIILGVDIVTKGQVVGDNISRSSISQSIDKVLSKHPGRVKGLLSTMENIFESLSYEGITFPKDFLMFKKTLLTLEGIMTDIDPEYNRSDYIVWGALKKFYKDLFRLHNYFALTKEIFTFYGFGFRKVREIQKLLLETSKELNADKLLNSKEV